MNNNDGYYRMAEFCCEFAAELVDPKCQKNQNGNWVNGDGHPPHAPVEALVCDIFDTSDVSHKSNLKQQARDACFCFYRDLGCGREELSKGGYCDYPNSEVTLDDFRMANNSAHNMCNACLENDNEHNYDFPIDYEGLSHNRCLGFCLLKRGDPNDVYAPTVSDKQCCFDSHGFGFDMNGQETDKIEKEIIWMPFETLEKREYDHFFHSEHSEVDFLPILNSSREYEVTMSYNGLSTAFITIERYGDGSEHYPAAFFHTSEFDIKCEPEDWDSLSVHIYDESDEGGIAFKSVTMDDVELGDFGFAVQLVETCTDTVIMAHTLGIHGSNHTCISRPGGFGHMAGFELKGLVELSGLFNGDDIGLELIVGCSQKKKEEEKTCCCGDDGVSPIKGYASPW